MPQKQKTGYCQHASPNDVILDKISAILNKTNSPALEYWKTELSSKDPATANLYLHSFEKFLQFTGKTALIMRKGDYPKGESIGVRVATKEAVLKAIENKKIAKKKFLLKTF